MHACDTVARSFFDNLDLLPLRLRLLAHRGAPATLIGGDLPPPLNRGCAIVAFAIARHRGRRLSLPTVFELSHQVVCKVLFRLANRTSDTQPRIYIQRYATPEGATFIGFGIAPFSPLLPT